MSELSIAVFVSGGGTNLQALIDAAGEGRLNGRISAVISNNSGSHALVRAANAGINGYHISGKRYPDGSDFVTAILEALDKHTINLIILAGYMKLLPIEIIRKFKSRIINIHPALLPKYGGEGMYGLNVHRAVIRSGDMLSGASVHFVDEIFDHGAILIQRTVPVLSDDSPESLSARVLRIEHKILPMAVRMFL